MNVESFYNPDSGDGYTPIPSRRHHRTEEAFDRLQSIPSWNPEDIPPAEELYLACLERDTAVRRAQWMTMLSGFSRVLGDPLHAPQKELQDNWNTLCEFGRKLRLYRLLAGTKEAPITLHALSSVLGITNEFLSGVETGRYPPFTESTVKRIGDALQLTGSEYGELQRLREQAEQQFFKLTHPENKPIITNRRDYEKEKEEQMEMKMSEHFEQMSKEEEAGPITPKMPEKKPESTGMVKDGLTTITYVMNLSEDPENLRLMRELPDDPTPDMGKRAVTLLKDAYQRLFEVVGARDEAREKARSSAGQIANVTAELSTVKKALASAEARNDGYIEQIKNLNDQLMASQERCQNLSKEIENQQQSPSNLQQEFNIAKGLCETYEANINLCKQRLLALHNLTEDELYTNATDPSVRLCKLVDRITRDNNRNDVNLQSLQLEVRWNRVRQWYSAYHKTEHSSQGENEEQHMAMMMQFSKTLEMYATRLVVKPMSDSGIAGVLRVSEEMVKQVMKGALPPFNNHQCTQIATALKLDPAILLAAADASRKAAFSYPGANY